MDIFEFLLQSAELKHTKYKIEFVFKELRVFWIISQARLCGFKFWFMPLVDDLGQTAQILCTSGSLSVKQLTSGLVIRIKKFQIKDLEQQLGDVQYALSEMSAI